MDASVLDTLVKLAAFGSSGISILIVFWVGWVIQHDTSGDPERHKTLRFYMALCGAIALISAGAGALNASNNSKALGTTREELSEANKAKGEATAALEARKAELEKVAAELRSKDSEVEKVKLDIAQSKRDLSAAEYKLEQKLGELKTVSSEVDKQKTLVKIANSQAEAAKAENRNLAAAVSKAVTLLDEFDTSIKKAPTGASLQLQKKTIGDLQMTLLNARTGAGTTDTTPTPLPK